MTRGSLINFFLMDIFVLLYIYIYISGCFFFVVVFFFFPLPTSYLTLAITLLLLLLQLCLLILPLRVFLRNLIVPSKEFKRHGLPLFLIEMEFFCDISGFWAVVSHRELGIGCCESPTSVSTFYCYYYYCFYYYYCYY